MSSTGFEPNLERVLLGIAHALFMNRLHVLRLTEVVRLGIRPNEEGILDLPPRLDAEMKQLAIDYILTTLPEELHPALHAVKAEWLRPA